MKTWKKLFGLFIAGAVLTIATRADNPQIPWSIIVESTAKSSVLVLISPDITEQTRHAERLRSFWKSGGIPKNAIPGAEDELRKQIVREQEIRTTYPTSGLYSNEVPARLLWKTDVYSIEDWFLVSDNHESIVRGKFAIQGTTREVGVPGNPNVSETTSATPNISETVLSFYSFGKLIRSYTAAELVTTPASFKRTTSNAFLWRASASIDETKSIVIVKLFDDTTLSFDLATGERRDTGVKSQKQGKDACVGGVIMFLLAGGFVLTFR